MDTIKNFNAYKTSLIKYLGEEDTNKILEIYEASIKNATFANTVDTGLAFEGSFVDTVLKITSYAIKINDLLPEEKQADKASIVKVGLLSHIAKCIMFEPNDNSWEVTNRGIIYKFIDLDGALRTGERSILMMMNLGIQFTAEEFEAMRIMDKTAADDNYTKYYSSTLSMVIRQANEIITAINKKK